MPAFHNAKYPYKSRDKVGVEPTFHNLVMRFPEILLIHKVVGRAGFEPAKLYKSHARLNLIKSYYSESRVPSSKSNTIKHGVTVRVFDLFTTYPYV